MNNTPRILTYYLIKEFNFSLFIFFGVFLSLVLMTTFIEEMIFFKDKNIDDYFFLKVLVLTFIKAPTLIITLSPFIFLFSAILFYVKLVNKNEAFPLNLFGFSNNFASLIPAIYSFCFGIMIIAIFSPISSEFLKIYEKTKQKYSKNDNLIIIKETGVWLKENKNNNKFLVKFNLEKDNNFSNIKDITIYKFNNEMSFLERLDSEKGVINKNIWTLLDVRIVKNNKTEKLEKYNYESLIDLEKLKNFYTNTNVFSVWNIMSELKTLKERGYYGQEFLITFNKYLSLPFMLFGLVIISTIFTLNLNRKLNIFNYCFYGILIGIIIYFLADASIALGVTGRIPLVFSVWMPVIIVLIVSTYSLLKTND